MIERISILGNHIHCFKDFRALYDYTKLSLKDPVLKGYVTVNNVHTMMEGYRNKAHREIINNAFLSIPDGKPLEIVGRLKGNRTITRLFGPTVMERFLDWGRHDGMKHFFIGSSKEVLEGLKASIEKNYPGTKIAGMIAPPFAPLENWPNDQYLYEINQSQPDFIWVGLGAPKQEAWMANTVHALNRGIMIGIGAGFAYVSGHTQHAPTWMKNASLEWLFRLSQEPGRLWKRYLTTIPPFMLLATLELLGWRKKN